MTDQTTRRGGGTGAGRGNRGFDTQITVRAPRSYRDRADALAERTGRLPADVRRTALAIGLDWLEQTDGAALRTEDSQPPV